MLRIITTLLILINTVTIHPLYAQEQTTQFRGWIDDEFYKGTQTDIEGEKKTLKISAKTGKTGSYVAGKHKKEVQDSLPEGFHLSWNTERTKNYEQVILNKENNLYHFRKSGSVLKQITSNPKMEENPTFSPDGKKIAFTRGGNLYTVDLKNGLERMLSSDGSDLVYNGYASWVYFEEILGRRSRYKAFWWSPDSKKIAFLRFDDSPVPIFPIFRSAGVHGELEQMHYPKVGDPNPLVKLGIINTASNKTIWVNTDESKDQYIAWPFWTRDSKKLLFQQMPRDQNKIELMLTDTEDGSYTKIYEESRPTWVEFFEDIHMMEDGSGFILRSYKNDWRNLYYYDYTGKLKARITDVKWRVSSIEKVLEKQQKIFFKGSGENNTDEHLFSANLDGSNFEQHTKGAGVHDTYISESGSFYTDIHESHSKAPSTIIIQTADKSKSILDPGKQKEFDSKTDHKTELFLVKSKDGKFDLPVKWTLPPNFKKRKKYPVVFTIYGGPNSGWNG
jgi:dipeptidyl-peptidase 4